MIEVRCEPHELLNWDRPDVAEPFHWRLRLGLEQTHFPLREELRLAALGLAIEKFSVELLPIGGQGVVLYQGPLEFPMEWTQALEDQCLDSELTKKEFAVDCYGNYFQMLAHKFPDETPLFLLFEPTISPGETLSLLSRPALEHFQIGLKNPSFARRGWRWDGKKIFQVTDGPKRALVFPEGLQDFSQFDGMSKDFELILESRLNEEWDGLEEIHLLTETISARGERMLKGFEAAGGKINRGRGI